MKKKTKNVVYCGPTIPRVAKYGTTFEDGVLTQQLRELISRAPVVGALVVSDEDFPATDRAISQPGSRENNIYHAIITTLKGGK